MSDPGSISRCIAAIRKQDHGDAMARISDRYFERLATIAGRKLHGVTSRTVDRHAIANQVLFEFFDKAQGGRLPDVQDRNDLLPLLVRMTRDQVTDEIRKAVARKRGGGATRGNSIFARAERPMGFDDFAGDYDNPSTRRVVEEQTSSIMQRLPDESMRTILLLRMEGYSNAEIAKELNISVATVERKRRRIRDLLAELSPDNDAP